MREISIDLSHRQSNPTVFAGYEGEHNATQVTVVLPIEMANSKEITTFYPRFCTSYREDYVGETIINTGNQKIIFKAHQAITCRGKTEIQIEGKDNEGNIIARSALGYLVFNPSVNNQGKELGLVINDAEELTKAEEGLRELIDEASELLDDADLSSYYNKVETDGFLDEKADKSTSLAGYGITDAYTKEEVDELTNPARVLIANGDTVYLENNKTYYAKEPINRLNVSYPYGDFIASLEFTVAKDNDGIISISLPQSKYIGGAPTLADGETWELNIKNGVVAGGLVE